MGKRSSPHRKSVRTIDVPIPADHSSPGERLASLLGSRAAALSAVAQITGELGLPAEAPHNVSAALALTRLGQDAERVASSLSWEEFEEYCALAISAAGYSVRRNVRLRKPTRQIDIVAESPSLVLSVDCKHWRRGSGAASLEAQALAQEERTRIYAGRAKSESSQSYLPVLLTMLDNQVRVVGGVPVVPLQALRGFLSTVSRFDEGLSFISAG